MLNKYGCVENFVYGSIYRLLWFSNFYGFIGSVIVKVLRLVQEIALHQRLYLIARSPNQHRWGIHQTLSCQIDIYGYIDIYWSAMKVSCEYLMDVDVRVLVIRGAHLEKDLVWSSVGTFGYRVVVHWWQRCWRNDEELHRMMYISVRRYCQLYAMPKEHIPLKIFHVLFKSKGNNVHFAVTPSLIVCWLQMFAHTMTAQLAWRTQIIVMIT